MLAATPLRSVGLFAGMVATLLVAPAVAQDTGGLAPPPPPPPAAAPAVAPHARPFPSLAPFRESRFWKVATAGVRAGGLTSEVLAAQAQEFAIVRSTKAEADEAVAEMFGGKPPPKDVQLGADVPEARRIWLWQVPIVLDALAPLWAAAEWDDARLALAQVAAGFFAQQKDAPRLAFAEGRHADNHRQLEALAAWFEAECAKPASYALMIVTDDDGPWLPLKAKAPKSKPARTRALDDERTLAILREDKPGAPWLVQLRRGDKPAWTVALTQVPAEERLVFSGAPLELESHGWLVPLSFGEYTPLYLDPKAEPLFYFTSW